MTQYYKVVREDYNEGLTSCFTKHPDLACSYRLNEWTTAPVGGMLVFDNLKRARQWLKGMNGGSGNYALFRCSVDQPRALPRAPLPLNVFFFWDVKLWWQRKNGAPKGRDLTFYGWPQGTKAFKRVKLTSRVD